MQGVESLEGSVVGASIDLTLLFIDDVQYFSFINERSSMHIQLQIYLSYEDRQKKAKVTIELLSYDKLTEFSNVGRTTAIEDV